MPETSNSERVLLAHGGGGQLSEALIRETILPRIGQGADAVLADAARVAVGDATVMMTTDSFVVKPLFFPGGDIGSLAVCGTVNDLAVAGASPLALSLGLIIEAGFPREALERVLDSIGRTADETGVRIVTGDTKTVETGSADGLFINTAGIGAPHPRAALDPARIEPGDRILLSGTVGDHGMTILSLREELRFESPLQSDCAALAGLIGALLDAQCDIKFLRDPTRGGVAATLNELARATGLAVALDEAAVPVTPAVQSAADMLGFDVLTIANEGKFVAVVGQDDADRCLEICRRHRLGTQAQLVGDIEDTETSGLVTLRTRIGGRRIIQMPYGRNLPRIC